MKIVKTLNAMSDEKKNYLCLRVGQILYREMSLKQALNYLSRKKCFSEEEREVITYFYEEARNDSEK